MKCIRALLTTAPAFALAAALAALTPEARADGYRNPPPTAAGVASAGAGYAWTDGAAAVSSNPAGLMDLDAAQTMAAVTFTRLGSTFEPAGTGLRLSAEDEWNLLPSLYAGGPSASGSWAWGIGLTTPYGQSMNWSADDPSPWRYVRPFEASMTLLEAAPSAAFRIGENVAIGLALSLYLSELEFKQQVASAQIFEMAGPDGILHFDGDAEAVGGTVGIHWQAAEAVRLALSYRAPVRLRYSGKVRANHPWIPADLPESTFRTTIELPDMVVAACGVQVGERMRLEVAVEHLRWSRYEEQTISVTGPLPVPDQSIAHRWEDTWTFGLAGEWQATECWAVRAGYRFMQTPVPDETYSLVLPDADRHVIGLGVGYTRGRHSVDAAWSFNRFRSRTIAANVNPAIIGRHTYDADLAGLTYRYEF